MTIHPARLARIRTHQEHAVAAVLRDESLTHTDVIALTEGLTDLLADYTNTHRGTNHELH